MCLIYVVIIISTQVLFEDDEDDEDDEIHTLNRVPSSYCGNHLTCSGYDNLPHKVVPKFILYGGRGTVNNNETQCVLTFYIDVSMVTMRKCLTTVGTLCYYVFSCYFQVSTQFQRYSVFHCVYCKSYLRGAAPQPREKHVNDIDVLHWPDNHVIARSILIGWLRPRSVRNARCQLIIRGL